MKLRSKIAASFALLGAVGMASAESITFGVQVPPIASLMVRDGVIRGVSGLAGTIAAADVDAAKVVGGFTVVTNMPKWNLYFAFANDGKLMSNSGTYLMAGTKYLPLGKTSTAATATTPGQVWLKFASATSQIKGTDGAATALSIGASTSIKDAVVTSTQNTLTGALKAATLACDPSGTPTTCADNGWVFATGSSTATIDIATMIDNTVTVDALAGTYTETMYVTLLTAY